MKFKSLIKLFLTNILLINIFFNFLVAEEPVAAKPAASTKCEGVKLNTQVPFINTQCIKVSKDSDITPSNAFPKLIGGISKILLTLTLAFSFLMIVIGGTLISAHGASNTASTQGKDIIKRVIIGIVLLGLSGVILHFINPNFFK